MDVTHSFSVIINNNFMQFYTLSIVAKFRFFSVLKKFLFFVIERPFSLCINILDNNENPSIYVLALLRAEESIPCCVCDARARSCNFFYHIFSFIFVPLENITCTFYIFYLYILYGYIIFFLLCI